MKGIREAAMSKEAEPDYYDSSYRTSNSKAYMPQHKSLFDYDNYPVKKYQAPVKDVVEVKFSISVDDVGETGDDSTAAYDWEKAQKVAEEIAYDRLIELCGKEVESRYSLEFSTYDDGFVYEVTCTLTPNK
jgi:hypothetical protein